MSDETLESFIRHQNINDMAIKIVIIKLALKF